MLPIPQRLRNCTYIEACSVRPIDEARVSLTTFSREGTVKQEKRHSDSVFDGRSGATGPATEYGLETDHHKNDRQETRAQGATANISEKRTTRTRKMPTRNGRIDTEKKVNWSNAKSTASTAVPDTTCQGKRKNESRVIIIKSHNPSIQKSEKRINKTWVEILGLIVTMKIEFRDDTEKDYGRWSVNEK